MYIILIFLLLVNMIGFCSSSDLIPHIIHYVWAGDNPKSDIVRKCIATWKKFCPDWLLVQWSDETFLPLKNDFAREAYNLKKYAFVADYIRVYALATYGGIYLDSDVELTAPIDRFLNHSIFLSQTRGVWKHVAPDFYGSVKGHPLLKEMLQFYSSHHFIQDNGSYDETWVGIRFSQAIKKLYNITLTEKIQTPVPIPDNGIIYPGFFFEEKIGNKENYAIHHITATWNGKKYEQGHRLALCFEKCRNESTMGGTDSTLSESTSRRSNWNSDYGRWFILFIIVWVFMFVCRKQIPLQKGYHTR